MRTLLAVLTAVALAGCGADEGTPAAPTPATATPAATPSPTAPPAATPTPTPPATPAPTPPPQASVAVDVRDFSFQPADVTIARGQEVVWTNADPGGHTVTADDGSFNSGHLPASGTFVHAFATAGVFAYHCAFHPDMTGTVTVTA